MMMDKKIIFIGRYPQNMQDEREQIAWRVIKEESDARLLLCEKGLDVVLYHSKRKKAFWENSDLRQWMSRFYETAFSDEEKTKIMLCKNSNGSNFEWDDGRANETEDYLFALSSDEAKEYFENNYERRMNPTPFAMKRGAYVFEELGNTSAWWLRSPGRRKGASASVVRADGGIYRSADMSADNICVRPAMWIRK